MLKDNMGTNKHTKSHLKRPKKLALKRMLRIWHHIKGHEKHECQKMLEKIKFQARVMLGNTIRAPKRMLNDIVKDTMYIKKNLI
jgi:hypothetical protein